MYLAIPNVYNRILIILQGNLDDLLQIFNSVNQVCYYVEKHSLANVYKSYTKNMQSIAPYFKKFQFTKKNANNDQLNNDKTY